MDTNVLLAGLGVVVVVFKLVDPLVTFALHKR
jgi:hypothetical protein